METYDNKSIPPMKTRKVRIAKWVIFFVDANEYYEVVGNNDKIKEKWALYKDNLVMRTINDVLYSIGSRDSDPIKDFQLHVRDRAQTELKHHFSAKFALVFDCVKFQNPKFFDKIVLAHRKMKGDPFQYYCVNTLKDKNADLMKCDSSESSCNSCASDSPSRCIHTCIEQLIEDLSS